MHIMQSWKESIALLKPSNFKLFFLVSVKACMGAIITMIKYWWWLIFLYWSEWFFWSQDSFYGAGLAADAIKAILLILFLCSLRASAAIKDYKYFGRMLLKVWYVIPLSVFFFWISSQIPVIPAEWESWFYFFWTGEVMYLFILFLLFILDSNGSMQESRLSLSRAFKMLIFNLPWLFIINLVFHTIEWIVFFVSFYLAQFSHVGATITSELLVGIFYSLELALIVNFYIKRLYDQIELYFVLP